VPLGTTGEKYPWRPTRLGAVDHVEGSLGGAPLKRRTLKGPLHANLSTAMLANQAVVDTDDAAGALAFDFASIDRKKRPKNDLRPVFWLPELYRVFTDLRTLVES